MAAGPAVKPSPREKYRWLVWPAVLLIVLLPFGILAKARSWDLPGLLVSYLNVLVIILSMIYFLRRRTFQAMIPVLFLVWLLFSWPLSTIYFGLFAPDAAYVTVTEEHRPFLDGNLRVQMVDLLFLAGYLPIVMLFLPRGKSLTVFDAQNPATKRIVYVAVGISMCAFAGGLYARVT